MLFSIITVTRNAGSKFFKTVQSILSQEFDAVEIVVINGGERDEYVSRILSSDISNLVYHEGADDGIYDAMNIGMEYATGEYVLFLNSGDCFFKNDVLSQVERRLDGSDIYVGSHIAVGRVKRPKPLEKLWQGEFCSHQALFIRRDLLRQYKFNLRYRLASDFNQQYSLFLDGHEFRVINEIISIVEPRGVSDTKRDIVINEFELISADSLQRVVYFKYRKSMEIFKSLIKEHCLKNSENK